MPLIGGPCGDFVSWDDLCEKYPDLRELRESDAREAEWEEMLALQEELEAEGCPSWSDAGNDDAETPELRIPLSLIDPHPLNAQIYGPQKPSPEFVESIRQRGIHHSLIVVPRGERYRLISGHSRFEAAKQLGIETVLVKVAQVAEADEARMLVECNHQREKTPSQRLQEAEVLEPLLKAEAHKRMLAGVGADGSGGRSKKGSGEHREPRTRDALARRVGLGSGAQLDRLREVAQKRPDLLQAIDAGKKTTGGAWAELRRAEKLQQHAELAAKVQPRADVLLGDCLELLPTLQAERFACIVTDPPYAISNEGRAVERVGTVPLNSDFGEWDHLSDAQIQELINGCAAEFFRLLKPGGALYLFPGDHLLPFWVLGLKRAGFALPRPYLLAWTKPNPPPSVRKRGWRSALEPIVYALKPDPDTFNFLTDEEMRNTLNFPVVAGDRLHPTEKPVGLIERLIHVSTLPGDEILDPFAGSGSTGEAAIRAGRTALLIERNPNFHGLATARIHKATQAVKRGAQKELLP